MNVNLERDEIFSKFQGTFKKFIIGFEEGHQHIMLVTKPKDEWMKGSIHKKLRDWVKKTFNVQGNGQYSIKYAKNEKQLSKYVVKDGDYKSVGFSDKELALFLLCSNKKGLSNLKVELNKIEASFFSDEIDIVELYALFVKIKIKYGQNIYPNHMDAYVMKIYFKKYPALINTFVSDRLSNLNILSSEY